MRTAWVFGVVGGALVAGACDSTDPPTGDAHDADAAGASMAGGASGSAGAPTGAAGAHEGGSSGMAGGAGGTLSGGTAGGAANGGASGASAGATGVAGQGGSAGNAGNGGWAGAGGLGGGGADGGGAGQGGMAGNAGSAGSSCTGAPFSFETIAEGPTYHVSIEVDAVGRPHVSYAASLDGWLRYAWRTGDEWHLETITEDGSSIVNSKMALDAADRPCVAYTASDNTVRVACREAENDWRERFSAPGYTAVALDIDASGAPHVLWKSGTNVLYATGQDASSAQDLGSAGLSPRLSIGVNAGNTVHALVANGDELLYSVGSGVSFTTTPLVTAGAVQEIADCDLALDAQGGVHLVYSDPSHAGLFVGYRGPDSPSFEELSDPAAVRDLRLAFDPMHGPHVAYRVAFTGYTAVRLAHRCEGAWTWEVVEQANGFPDLAFAPDGTLHIVYAETLGTNAMRLRYSFR